ncbi:MAG: glutamate-5-semialdehyde dehydrogenase [Candidatus Omnitrophica bacterium]|nr:glutamate-5-semialdehyde dehydrogenase [Candidatus Omnitrophota bacterium]
MSIKKQMEQIAKDTKAAGQVLAITGADQKDKALKAMANALRHGVKKIIKANNLDLKSARAKGLQTSLIDRLRLDEKRVKAMAKGLEDIIKLSDPVGEVIKMTRRPNGLQVGRIRVPIGVIGIIYEARPNVTSDAAGLCLKSGNAVILRGGSLAIHSNKAVADYLRTGLKKAGLPAACISLVKDTSRQAVDALLKLDQYIDLIIPRGGESLIHKVTRSSRIPVIKHYKGVCHVYVDELADLNMAEEICFNAKVQRPGVCNAMETMLVHKDAAARFLPSMVRKFKQAGVEIRGCDQTGCIVKGIKKAKKSDWPAEYLDLILAVKIVGSLDEAVRHIQEYGSSHTEAIVTDDYKAGMDFLNKVDSACVFINASTRFSDGGEFGLGAEIGISTDKIHARGPMGLEELTTYKNIVFGSGQIRS